MPIFPKGSKEARKQMEYVRSHRKKITGGGGGASKPKRYAPVHHAPPPPVSNSTRQREESLRRRQLEQDSIDDQLVEKEVARERRIRNETLPPLTEAEQREIDERMRNARKHSVIYNAQLRDNVGGDLARRISLSQQETQARRASQIHHPDLVQDFKQEEEAKKPEPKPTSKHWQTLKNKLTKERFDRNKHRIFDSNKHYK